MPKPRHRVQIATYNGHLGASMDARNPDLAAWLIPTLDASTKDANGEAPDFFAVGFQEMIALHLSLLGITQKVIDEHDDKIKAVIESHVAAHTRPSRSRSRDAAPVKETYTLMAKKVLGGIVLLVYTRDKTVTKNVVEVRVATAACGIFGMMGNKGAVGVRVVIDENAGEGEVDEDDDEEDDEEDEEEEDDDSEKSSTKKRSKRRERLVTAPTVFTFVTSHLAAHDHGLQRRNADWKSIVERLVFTNSELSRDFKPRKKVAIEGALGRRDEQVYDTSYLFFFGDLNYRISTKTPRSLPVHVLAHKIINEQEELLTHDQLRQEQSAGRTLHGLKEGAITFRPTYKYKPGTVSEFKKFTKRVPGWCDRILFATWADGSAGAGTIKKAAKASKKGVAKQLLTRRSSRFRDDEDEDEDEAPQEEKKLVEKKRKGVKVEYYKSIMSFTGSDHKPVTALVSLPRSPKPSKNSAPSALRLVLAAPFAIDPTWRRRQSMGRALDRFVGFFWCLFMLLGFNKNAGLGFGNFTAAAIAAWYYQEVLASLVA